MISSETNQQDDTYLSAMSILHDSLDITQSELAKKLGLSGSIYCLKALIDKGRVKIQNFSNNKNKLGYSNLRTSTGIVKKASLTCGFL